MSDSTPVIRRRRRPAFHKDVLACGQSILPGWPSIPPSTTARSPAYPSPGSNADVDSIKGAIRELEAQLQEANSRRSESDGTPGVSLAPPGSTAESIAGGAFFSHRDSKGTDRPRGASRSVWHKTRLFGQSHWVNGIVDMQDIFALLEPVDREDVSRTLSKVTKCKTYARTIKAGLMPEWPLTTTAEIPSKDIADQLVVNYLETYESMLRVLHVPSFQKEYEGYWTATSASDPAFVLLLKQILAIGAGTYDGDLTMRKDAVSWMCEAQIWLSKPNFKSRLNLRTAQIYILNLLAQETTGVGNDFCWTSCGSLYRLAMMMGLHRDPKYLPKLSFFEAEMRRRLWNTIIELDLRASLTTGSQPLMSLDQFDTEPPGNYDDEDLILPTPPSQSERFTSITLVLAYQRTFPLRLRIVHFLNDIGSSGTYDETLRLDADFRTAYKHLRQAIQTSTAVTNSNDRAPTDFQLKALDYIMSRYLLALHVPCFSVSTRDKTFAYSRSVVLDTAMRIWDAANTFAGPDGKPDQLAQLIHSASGFYRVNASHAITILALDIRSQVRREDSLGPVTLRKDQLAMLQDAQTWHLNNIEMGEVSCKGYLCIVLLAAHIEGLMRGLEKEAMVDMLVRKGEEALERVLPILEARATLSQPDGNDADLGIGSGAVDETMASLMGWNEYLAVDGLFDWEGMDVSGMDWGGHTGAGAVFNGF